MSTIASPKHRALGGPCFANGKVDVCASGPDLSASAVKIRPEDFPFIDPLFVGRVISGNDDLRWQLGTQALDPDAGSPRSDGAPCAFGTRPCPPDCRSVNVWGLSKKMTEEELLFLCRNFGAAANILLLLRVTGTKRVQL
jgi:hypothetical protein